MPYRRLPNTDTARLRALETALKKTEHMPPFDLPISVSTHQELKCFYPEFQQALIYHKETYDRQVSKSKSHLESMRKAKLYISHFVQVLNFAIIRGELKPNIRELFGLDLDEKKLPNLNTEKDLIEWGEKLIAGEQARIAQGQSPITNPTIARVKVHYEEFIRNHQSQKYLQETHYKATQKIALLREKADKIILNIWNEVENNFSNLKADERRMKSETYGVIYVYRKNEKLSFDKLTFETTTKGLKIG